MLRFSGTVVLCLSLRFFGFFDFRALKTPKADGSHAGGDPTPAAKTCARSRYMDERGPATLGILYREARPLRPTATSSPDETGGHPFQNETGIMHSGGSVRSTAGSVPMLEFRSPTYIYIYISF